MTWQPILAPSSGWVVSGVLKVFDHHATWDVTDVSAFYVTDGLPLIDTMWRTDKPQLSTTLTPVYPLPTNPAGDLDFVFHIQSDGHGFIESPNQFVQVKSRITDGP